MDPHSTRHPRKEDPDREPHSILGPMTRDHKKKHRKSQEKLLDASLEYKHSEEFRSLPEPSRTPELAVTSPSSASSMNSLKVGDVASIDSFSPLLRSAKADNGNGSLEMPRKRLEEKKEREICESKDEESGDLEEKKEEALLGEVEDVTDSNPPLTPDVVMEESTEEPHLQDQDTQTDEDGTIHFVERDNPEFPINQQVFVVIGMRYVSGKIRWTGSHYAIHDSKLAVVELDENYHAAHNGRFLGQTLCRTKKNRALMVEANQLQYRVPFHYGQRCHTLDKPGRLGTIWNVIEKTATVEWDLEYQHRSPSDVELTVELSISKLQGLKTSRGDPCTFPVQPISPRYLDRLFGKHRGIQGDSNSCYLDTTLFCLFAFSSYWERLIERSNKRQESDLLLQQVVYPLRAEGFVPAYNVQFVRQALCDATGRKEFASVSRDLPEALEALLGKMLDIQPMVMTASLGRDSAPFPASFSIETMPPLEQPKICTSQHFLESSAVSMEFQLTAVPECLILLLPREKGYLTKEIIPSLELDLEAILEGGEKLCHICGQAADIQCPERMVNCSAASTFFCSSCLELSDSPLGRKIPLKKSAKRKGNCRLILSAVICISHSHYNCFARCGKEWVFFDSMHDRDVFGGRQHCIPSIRKVDLNSWIRQKLGGRKFLVAQKQKDISERAFFCPYALIYNTPE